MYTVSQKIAPLLYSLQIACVAASRMGGAITWRIDLRVSRHLSRRFLDQLLSTAKSANIGFSQVVQLFAPPTNPANAPRTENSFYKFRKKIFGCQQCVQKY